jgi:hypothetical protein
MWPDASQTIELLRRAGEGDAAAVNGLHAATIALLQWSAMG